MLSKLVPPHLPLLTVFGLLFVVIGAAQSLTLLYLASENLPMLEQFLFQAFSGTVDVLFPFLMMTLALGLMAAEIESGLIRHYAAAPYSRRSIFTYHCTLLYLASCFYLLLYLLSVSTPFVLRQLVVPSTSVLIWIPVVLLTPLSFLVIQLLLLFFYFVTRSSVGAFATTLVLLFLSELVAGITGLYSFFPSTNISLSAQWVSEWTNGFHPEAYSLVAGLTGVIAWSIILYIVNLRLFSGLNLHAHV